MTRGERREADTSYSTYEKQLVQRGFQTGDILVTGSDILGPSSFIAQCGKISIFFFSLSPLFLSSLTFTHTHTQVHSHHGDMLQCCCEIQIQDSAQHLDWLQS